MKSIDITINGPVYQEEIFLWEELKNKKKINTEQKAVRNQEEPGIAWAWESVGIRSLWNTFQSIKNRHKKLVHIKISFQTKICFVSQLICPQNQGTNQVGVVYVLICEILPW